MDTIMEPAKSIPVIGEADVCVLGGSCTGVFAAVRAARLGAKVVIVEKQNSFGGVATSGLVNVWHSLYDNEKRQQIIAGLSYETIERLKKRDAIIDMEATLGVNDCNAYRLNTEELKIELDNLILEAKVKPYLHTHYVGVKMGQDAIEAVFIHNKSGRGAIKAKVYIDATGDGDLCRDAGLHAYTAENMQPPTACAKIYGMNLLGDFNLPFMLQKHGEEFGLQKDWGWRGKIPGMPEVSMHAETHVFDVNCAVADMLTYSEMEGRRQIRAVMDLIRKYAPNGKKISLVDLCSYIGIRETYHIESMYKLKNKDVLYGTRFQDAIANGSYRVDIHHSNEPGITFRYLNGVEEVVRGNGMPHEFRRWREETEVNPTYYQIPYRSLVSQKVKNLLMAGRMLDAEEEAYSAVRVMVNTNQTGEAAGVAAYVSLAQDGDVRNVNANDVRKLLKEGGSIIL